MFGPGSKPTKINDGFVVVSPTDKGLVLMRQFAGNRSNLDELYKVQNNLNCKLADF